VRQTSVPASPCERTKSQHQLNTTESSDEDPEDEKITEDDRLYDKSDEKKKIFTRAVVKSNTDAHGRQKKSPRVLKVYHPCLFCKKRVINFAQHVMGKEHEEESEIIKINKFDPRIKKEKPERKT
jgi:hypothetical protein